MAGWASMRYPMSTFSYFMPDEKGPRRPTIELGQPPKPPETKPDFDENEDDSDPVTTRVLTDEHKGFMELDPDDLTPLPDRDVGGVVDTRTTPDVALAREEARQILRQQREKAEVAAENRSGLREEIAASQDVAVRGGETKEALEKIFAFEKTKLEKLLEAYPGEDFASDIREELSDAELQLRMISEDDESGPAERADLNRVIEVAKYKLSVIDEWKKEHE